MCFHLVLRKDLLPNKITLSVVEPTFNVDTLLLELQNLMLVVS